MRTAIGVVAFFVATSACAVAAPLTCDDAGWTVPLTCADVERAARTELADEGGVMSMTAEPGLPCRLREGPCGPNTQGRMVSVYADLADGRRVAVTVTVQDGGRLDVTRWDSLPDDAGR